MNVSEQPPPPPTHSHEDLYLSGGGPFVLLSSGRPFNLFAVKLAVRVSVTDRVVSSAAGGQRRFSLEGHRFNSLDTVEESRRLLRREDLGMGSQKTIRVTEWFN